MKPKENPDEELEICYECGRSVAMGRGLFVDRVGSGDSVKEKREMGVPFPQGGWLCRECDERIFG